MATVKELKATLRSKAGKGAARAERRTGRTPAVIYGGKEPPLSISLDHAEVRTRIYHGRFLTTIYDIEIDGKKHRVIPRDYQLDPIKDFPIHVDFLRLSAGQLVRVNIPIHVFNSEASPGVKRGGTVNIVAHAIPVRCPPDRIPQSIDIDLTGMEINHSKHLSDVKLPEGVVPVTGAETTLVTIVAPSGFGEKTEAETAAAAAAAAPAAGAAAAPAAEGDKAAEKK